MPNTRSSSRVNSKFFTDKNVVEQNEQASTTNDTLDKLPDSSKLKTKTVKVKVETANSIKQEVKHLENANGNSLGASNTMYKTVQVKEEKQTSKQPKVKVEPMTIVETKALKRKSAMIETPIATDNTLVKQEIPKLAPPKKKKKNEKKKKNMTVLNKEPPKGWEQIWRIIEHLRAKRDAPVDTMGCAECHDKSAPKHVQQYQALISLMLSSQTKDQVNAMTMKRLINHGLTLENILATKDEVLKELISKVGFYNRKTVYIKKSSEIIRDQHNGLVPDTIEEIVKLPGVGPKMGYLLLSCAFGKHEGIGVDTHVHRICNQLNWCSSKTAEDTRKQMEAWLPNEKWADLNLLLVGIGQMIQQPAERAKLIHQMLTLENEEDAKLCFKLLKKFGLQIEKEASKAGIKL